MFSAIITGFAGSLVAPLMYKITRDYTGGLLALIPLCLCAYFASFLPELTQNGPLSFSRTWVSELDVHLSFYLDGLSLLFAVTITFIGILVLVYAGPYFKGKPGVGRFYAYILFFMSAMLGLVLSDNIITLFIFWELTGVSSFLLIGFDHEIEGARKAAWQALLVTGMGGLALLAGLLLLGQAGESYELSRLLTRSGMVQNHGTYPAIFLLISLGAFTKSAQFPFHFWLPDAMAAPTPVSTYLHSATMVKAGIYLLARMSPILGGTVLWHSVLIPVGAVTMILSAALSVRQTDLKRILAYSTVSVLGTLVFLLGLGTHGAIEAAMAYVMIHALYKAALFLIAGIVDHETGTRDIGKLSGLGWSMPITAGAAVLAGLSMAGLPPLFGFIGKELLYGATLDAPLAATLLTAVALSTNILLVAASGMAGITPFFGKRPDIPGHVHDPAVSMWFGPVILAGLGIAMGLLPNLFGTIWVSPAVAAVTGQTVEVKLALMHGFTFQLFLSVMTFCGGSALFIWRKRLLGLIPALPAFSRWTPSSVYKHTVSGILTFSRLQTRFLQNGHLHLYILTIVVTTVFLLGGTLLTFNGQLPPMAWNQIYIYEYAIVLVILAATVLVVGAPSRLIAIIALGVLGYSVVLFYVLYGAPDLAMTQFAIDTLTVIFLVLVIYRLPRYVQYSTPLERLRDGIPALAAGGLMTLLILFTLSVHSGSQISAYFTENAYRLAKGHNIVNVILVDFRALDTMGEITVLVVAGIGIFSMLKLAQRHGKDTTGKAPGR
jgi:multicomponent Na+:H+ antiporter subunit A